MTPARCHGPPGVSTARALQVRLAADDLRTDPAAVCADVVARLRETGARLVLADVVEPAPPAFAPGPPSTGVATHGRARTHLGTLDGLARLDLAVRRAGARLELVGPSADLRALLRLTGLAEVLASVSDLSEVSDVEVQRQPEGAEVVGADEVRDAADPPVAHLEQVDGPRVEATGDAAGLVLREAP
jgi:hypothetical protein